MNIVGAGRVGKTLAALWHERNELEVGSILNRSLPSSETAAVFIGGGTPASDVSTLLPSEFHMLSTPDDAIEAAAALLLKSGILRPGDTVFHCSGALPSSILSPLSSSGALVAAVHPVKSFADPASAIRSFDGTYCGFEGDSKAVASLKCLFESIGGVPFDIAPEAKVLYHTALNLVCQDFVALLEIGLQALTASGIDRSAALRIIEPLVRGTVDNVFKLGTVSALTGPIVRGDCRLVKRQLESLESFMPRAAEIYRSLGMVLIELAGKSGRAKAEKLAQLSDILSDDSGSR